MLQIFHFLIKLFFDTMTLKMRYFFHNKMNSLYFFYSELLTKSNNICLRISCSLRPVIFLVRIKNVFYLIPHIFITQYRETSFFLLLQLNKFFFSHRDDCCLWLCLNWSSYFPFSQNNYVKITASQLQRGWRLYLSIQT